MLVFLPGRVVTGNLVASISATSAVPGLHHVSVPAISRCVIPASDIEDGALEGMDKGWEGRHV